MSIVPVEALPQASRSFCSPRWQYTASPVPFRGVGPATLVQAPEEQCQTSSWLGAPCEVETTLPLLSMSRPPVLPVGELKPVCSLPVPVHPAKNQSDEAKLELSKAFA